MTALAIVLVVVLVAFLLGVVAPRKSRRAQAAVDRVLRRGERKADRNAGIAGEAAEGTLRIIERAEDKSGEAGRGAHDRVARAGR